MAIAKSKMLDTTYRAALKHRFDEAAPLFEKAFKKPLANFWHGTLGFNIILFEETVAKPQPNQSISEATKARFGQDAVKIIRLLLEPVTE